MFVFARVFLGAFDDGCAFGRELVAEVLHCQRRILDDVGTKLKFEGPSYGAENQLSICHFVKNEHRLCGLSALVFIAKAQRTAGTEYFLKILFWAGSRRGSRVEG